MQDEFILPVDFDGKTLEFPAKLITYGYSYKIEVDVFDTKVQFETDEERNWRAMITYDDVQLNKKLNSEMLKAIALKLEALL
ncbi:MAG TPA: hypothetical protein VFZ42_13490 [Chitinophagaceae bacterium]